MTQVTGGSVVHDDTDERATHGSWRGLVLPVVLAVLLLAVVATCVILVRDRRDEPVPAEQLTPANPADARGSDDPAASALATGAQAATTYFTVDASSVQADMDRMRALGTDDFVADYDRSADRLAQRIRRDRLRLSATLPTGGVATEFLTRDLAQVLVAVDVTRRAPDEDSTTAPHRVRVVLERSGGTWLVDSLDEVG